MTFQLIAAFLQSLLNLSGVLGPKIGEKAEDIFAMLRTARALIAQGNVGAADLRALTEEIDRMVEEGREPTDEEFAGLKARFDAAYGIAEKYLEEHGDG